ncbi:unnamed protein product [Laminaria digitata]
MAPLRQRSTRAFPSSSSAVGPARLVAGLLLTGSARSVHALVPNAVVSSSNPTALFRGPPRPIARSCVRRRGAWAMGLSVPGESEAGDIESSELYADMRRRLEDIRRNGDASVEDQLEDWSEGGADRLRTQRGGGGGGGGGGGEKGAPSGTKAYSGQEMKKAYYEAFWRARNLHKEAKFDVGIQADDKGGAAPSADPAAPPATPPTAQLASRSTLLTPMGMDLVLLSRAASAAASEAAALSTSDVQGLTQMYYLDEEAEAIAAAAVAAAPLAAASATVVVGGGGINNAGASVTRGNIMNRGVQKEEAGLLAGAGVVAFGGGGGAALEHAEPQGMTQMFFLDKEEEEAAVAAALPRSSVAEASFLRERLGVSGDVVQGLRQVELDHARLAMLAVLLTGAVGAGAGVPPDASFMDTQHGFAALADVARTPWLDPCVAGLILTVKALSEGDWRLGKGALASWGDQALRAVSDSGAKVLRLSSGDEMRRLAVEMEVKHGRLALGAVVCAMAQQGLATVGA